MQEVYAALILHESKLPINEENIKKILDSVGAKVDENKIKALVASLEGVNIDELLQQPVLVSQQVQEKKEEEKEEEKKSEEAVAGLSALFG